MLQLPPTWAILAAAPLLPMILALPAAAHVSEQSFVLLLPTGHYITSGVIAVLASILLISATPARVVEALFRPLPLGLPTLPDWVRTAISTISAIGLLMLLYIGWSGPRDPLVNLLPLVIWVGFWIGLFSLIGLVGNLWAYLNPWIGPYALLRGRLGQPPALPESLGTWPALAVFVLFFGFYMADPAPSDPDRLAVVVATYAGLTLCGVLIFGPTWLQRCEAFTVLFDLIARTSPFGATRADHLGFPGWALFKDAPVRLSTAIFAVFVLAAGSFDGLKETFWWFARLGINPLEHPGRTALVGSTLIGLSVSFLALLLALAVVLWAGRAIACMGEAQPKPALRRLFCWFAPTLLPIALGYHISHFLVTFMIDGQYLLAAIGDPFARGDNFLNLADIRVTTGFLTSMGSVRVIWLTQAGVVVVSHILAVLVSHRIALHVFETPRRAALSQIPLGAFMILYTLFGLWLLASPRA